MGSKNVVIEIVDFIGGCVRQRWLDHFIDMSAMHVVDDDEIGVPTACGQFGYRDGTIPHSFGIAVLVVRRIDQDAIKGGCGLDMRSEPVEPVPSRLAVQLDQPDGSRRYAKEVELQLGFVVPSLARLERDERRPPMSRILRKSNGASA